MPKAVGVRVRCELNHSILEHVGRPRVSKAPVFRAYSGVLAFLRIRGTHACRGKRVQLDAKGPENWKRNPPNRPKVCAWWLLTTGRTVAEGYTAV